MHVVVDDQLYWKNQLTSYLPQHLKFTVILQPSAESSAAFISNGILSKAVKDDTQSRQKFQHVTY